MTVLPIAGSHDSGPISHPIRRRMITSGVFWLGLGLLLFLVLFSFLGPRYYQKDVNTVNVARALLPPSWTFPLGTDVLGENELGRLMIGGQVPIIAGFVAALAATVLGGCIGIVAGLRGKTSDVIAMRTADAILGVPQVVAIVVAETIFHIGSTVTIIAFVLTAWPVTARLVRAETISLRIQPFVEAAHATGTRWMGLIWRHILPNLIDSFVATFTTQFTNAILVFAVTSFIGAGLGPPWNWATMINANKDALLSGQWWLIVLPGLLFAVLVTAVYLLGESIRSAFDPHTDHRGG